MTDGKQYDREQLKTRVKELLQAGAHFGHATHHWNPKMEPYIFMERGGLHVIDLEKTAKELEKAIEKVKDLAARGGKVIFVGTKREAQIPVREAARACHMPYVNIRWLGGTLTNWQTISERIRYLNERQAQYEAGEFKTLSKKERLGIEKEIDKLNRRLGGIKELTKIPELVFVVDAKGEELAVQEVQRVRHLQEAQRVPEDQRIALMAMVDTNCNPDPIKYVIPSNDDSHRPIRYIAGLISQAVNEGRERHLMDLESSIREDQTPQFDEPQYEMEEPDVVSEEDLLGPGVLRRLEDERTEPEASDRDSPDAPQ